VGVRESAVGADGLIHHGKAVGGEGVLVGHGGNSTWSPDSRPQRWRSAAGMVM
jgi:hypothetical protein